MSRAFNVHVFRQKLLEGKALSREEKIYAENLEYLCQAFLSAEGELLELDYWLRDKNILVHQGELLIGARGSMPELFPRLDVSPNGDVSASGSSLFHYKFYPAKDLFTQNLRERARMGLPSGIRRRRK